MKYLGGVGLQIWNIRLDFGTDPDLVPGSIFTLTDGHFCTLNKIAQKVVGECSWNFWE